MLGNWRRPSHAVDPKHAGWTAFVDFSECRDRDYLTCADVGDADLDPEKQGGASTLRAQWTNKRFLTMRTQGVIPEPTDRLGGSYRV
jgi:hypothetical protein